ncbi:FAD-dependent oxidoreductase [Leptothermofonsia sp. ETS-13]|uniref:FAD-dependent oxidoreductase n=1 Tax=Leptothermofonsia sp. ETS-13 TaxID=3035696 RepID=UPI003BA0F416
MHEFQADVLVVGGGTGGTAAALQAARRGANTILISEFPWLGGMLTSAGVAAPDGNELLAFQTGIWGAFLRELQQRQPEGLDHGWVSFFTYDPRVGAQIFADWVAALPNLKWIHGQVPLEVLKQGDRITGVRFTEFAVRAHITLDGTELGDLLSLGEIPYRWGWELQSEFGEPSAPVAPTPLMQRYPVQVPTWVVIMQDYGTGAIAPEIATPPNYDEERFAGAWERHGVEAFLNYGRLPGNRLMINWPIRGNDYGEGVQRLIESRTAREQFLQEARWHSQGFAHFIQTQIDRRYGLAEDIFPLLPNCSGGGAYALHPYYRESRRLKGQQILREQDILPIAGGCVASLPMTVLGQGCTVADNICDAIAIGNYPNDHHYPSGDIDLKPKSMRWGGRWTGTPFTIPYRCLVPETVEGFLVCEKNISVSHIANGATRLQPVVLGIGQAAGMAAALCVEQQCQPQELGVRSLQEAMLTDTTAPAAVIPLLTLPPEHPNWLNWQRYYLEHPEEYPANGNCPVGSVQVIVRSSTEKSLTRIAGCVETPDEQNYTLLVEEPSLIGKHKVQLVTLDPEMNERMKRLSPKQPITVLGKYNQAGQWLLVNEIID